MAVSVGRAVRALIETHALATFNRTLRDAGLAVTVLAFVTLVLVFIGLVVPLMGIAAWFGHRAGADLTSPGTLAAAGAMFTFVPLAACVLSLVAGDVQAIDQEKLKPYPVPPRALFVAELFASFGHPLMSGGALVLLAFAAGIVTARPAATPVIAVTFVTSLVFQAAAQSIISAIAARFVRRAKSILILLMTVAPGIAAIMLDRPEGHAAVDALSRNADLFLLLPSARQLEALVTGRMWLWRGLDLLLPLAAALLLLWLGARIAAREVAPRVATTRRPERLWSFRHPVLGVARLQIATMFDTELGRFALFLPLFWLVPLMLLRRAPAETPFASELTTLFVWVLLPTTMSGFTMNQFGLDRGAVKALFLLPVDEKDLLRGKSLGLTAVCAVQAVVVAALVVVFMHPPLPFALAGPLTSLTLLLIHLAVGQYLSVLWPRPIQRKGLKQPSAGAIGALVLLGVLFGTMGPVVLAWWAIGRKAPALLPLVMGASALAAFGLNYGSAWFAARLVVLRRERLVETLG